MNSPNIIIPILALFLVALVVFGPMLMKNFKKHGRPLKHHKARNQVDSRNVGETNIILKANPTVVMTNYN